MSDFDKQILLDFGSVYINSKASKPFEIQNTSSIDQVFKVKKCSEPPKLECGFSVNPSESPTVKPGTFFTFHVEFKPKVANIRCSSYFIIKHLYGIQSIIFAKATVEGPQCSLSCTQVQMICPADKKTCVKRFEIRNNGSCTTNYQLTSDNTNSSVVLQPSHGTIQPSKNICITVSYTPQNTTPYFKRIFCLITHHVPIVLDIYGLWLKYDKNATVNVVNENVPKYISGYHCFMNSAMETVVKSELPLVSVNVKNIDFKHCTAKTSKLAEFCLTNNFSSRLHVVWSQSLGKVFKIQPTELELEVNNSAALAVTFRPTVNDMLYGEIVNAQLFSDTKLLPFPVEINLKGHSFEESSCGWAAQYRVEPCNVLLPPCIHHPFHPSHSTLTIHRKGHLPLAFTFHPPENTNFSVKPQQGLIHGHFQIVVVQFYPRNLSNAVYTEKWLISFNSNENISQCVVEFTGSVETPQVVINSGEKVVFQNVHPGTPCDLLVDLYNPTRFYLWYNLEILKGDLVLNLEGDGELWPYEHKQVPWCFHPVGKGELEALVSCTPIFPADVEVKVTSVVVRGSCVETELKVVPLRLQFLKVLRDYQHERGFELINSGDAVIQGVLTWEPSENCCDEEIEVKFEPDSFKLEPGASVLVKVFVTPLTSGTKDITICYSNSMLFVTPLIPITINCVFPHLQVSDLYINNSGPLFTKFHFWKLLQIRKLNKVLHNLTLGRNEEVHMCFPSYLSGSEDINVEVLLENNSEVGVNVTLTQSLTCDCRPMLTQVSFSRSKLLDVCPHKDQMQIVPTCTQIKAQNYVILNIKVSYNTVGPVDCMFVLSLSPEDFEELNSTVALLFHRMSIPTATPFIDTTEPKENSTLVFNMSPVFIGDIHPFVQAFNVYNNTKQMVHYEVDDTTLQGTPFKYIPGEKTLIPPLSHQALLFTFVPYSCETYEREIKLTINSKPESLILRGSGFHHNSDKDEDDLAFFPRKEKLILLRPLNSAYFSTSHIDIGPLKPGNVQKHVIFINNKTKDVINFKWYTSKIQEVFELRVHPPKGAMQPDSVLDARVVSYSRGWPCSITTTLTCLFASWTAHSYKLQSHQKYRDDLAKCADYFIITEQGMENVELAPPAEVSVPRIYATISVTINVRSGFSEQVLPTSRCSLLQPVFKEINRDMSEHNKLLTMFLLEKVLWDALEEFFYSTSKKHDGRVERYIQLKCVTTDSDIPAPFQITQNTLEDVLYSAWQEMFQLSPRTSADHMRRTLFSQLKTLLSAGDESCTKILNVCSARESMNS